MRFARLHITHIFVLVLLTAFSGERMNELVCVVHGMMHETHLEHDHHMGHEHCNHHAHSRLDAGTVALGAKDHNCCIALEMNDAELSSVTQRNTMDDLNFSSMLMEPLHLQDLSTVFAFDHAGPVTDYANVRRRVIPSGFDLCILFCSFLN